MDFNSLFLKTNNKFIQILRYLLSGGIAFIFDFITLYVSTEIFKFHYIFSTIAGFIVGSIIIYLLSILWVFNFRKKNKFQEIILFLCIGLIGLCLTTLLMWIQTELMNIYFLVSKISTTIIVFGWNFISKKNILFSTKAPKSSFL